MWQSKSRRSRIQSTSRCPGVRVQRHARDLAALRRRRTEMKPVVRNRPTLPERTSLAAGNDAFGRSDRLIERLNSSIELLFVDGLHNFANSWAGLQPKGEHVAAEENRCGRLVFDAEYAGALEKPIHR